jgi:dienelactone hydrolase
MRLFGLTTILLAALANASVLELEGGWKGTWTRDGDAIPVTLKFERSTTGYSGSFDSDALQVTGIPFGDVREVSGRVHFLLRGDASTTVFDGTLAGDAMSGTFTDGDVKGTFELRRATLPGSGVRTREVMFQNKDVALAGTLLAPATPGRHPAILFLQGSGPEGRWANRYLAQKSAEAGVVALIYDKRGVGQSTGDWQKAGFDALAQDAVAGIRFLQSQPEVDGTRLGIYGHSQGGTIAPLVAVEAGDLGFVIASAAGGLPPADVETYSVGNSMGISQMDPAVRADAQSYLSALIDVAYRGKSRTTLDALAEKFKTKSWYFDAPPPDAAYWLISRQIAGFDPASYWRKVRAPVLLLYGAHDERVPPAASAEAIQSALREGGNHRVSTKIFTNADHTFTVVDPPHTAGWPRHVPNYAEILTDWIVSAK